MDLGASFLLAIQSMASEKKYCPCHLMPSRWCSAGQTGQSRNALVMSSFVISASQPTCRCIRVHGIIDCGVVEGEVCCVNAMVDTAAWVV